MIRPLRFYVLLLLFSTGHAAKSAIRDTTIRYNLPDSVKAVQFMAEIKVNAFHPKKWFNLGIQTDAVKLVMRPGRKNGLFIFYPGAGLNDITRGEQTGFDLKDFGVSFEYKWEVNETYKLLISLAADSAGNFSICSGYVFLPRENKWKYLGSGKIKGRSNTLQQPALVGSWPQKQSLSFSEGPVWVQRSNGSWKILKGENPASPVINLYGHLDSVRQRQADIKTIETAIAAGKTDAKQNEQGVYYTIMKEGTGRFVSVNDTVVVNYKGYLFSDGAVFDQTTDKPATFPLKRLIRGWQTGLPLCRVGGKIKLVIPSDLAYSVRTRAAKIPPNSILVFEIEVLDIKAP